MRKGKSVSCQLACLFSNRFRPTQISSVLIHEQHTVVKLAFDVVVLLVPVKVRYMALSFFG